jgi:crotonobetainyl-CoA:carnitine CoA-transferase CaiB-like acyl-CoA transferase
MKPTPFDEFAALSSIRVLDFTRVLAGPFCTMLLADMGADVIKVEGPQGDDTRQWGPPWYGEGDERQSAYYLSVNRNKRSITLNLKTDTGREIARQLAAQSHILVENFRPGMMAAFGLGYDDLTALNPALVYGSITGYGQTGPCRNRPGYDFVIQGQSGLMSITGAVDDEPHKVGVAISDVIAGLFATSSLLAALRHAERTGQGQQVDISLLDTSIAALVNVVSNALVSGETPPRYGNAHPSIVPYQTFRALDGIFTLAVGNDRQFASLCKLIERPDLSSDSRFSTNPGRVENRAALIRILDGIFLTRKSSEWVAALLDHDIPAGLVNDVTTVLDDPQVQARGLVQEIDLLGDVLRLVGNPVGFSATPATLRTPPPTVGQHTEEILRELLDMKVDEIGELRENGAI